MKDEGRIDEVAALAANDLAAAPAVVLARVRVKGVLQIMQASTFWSSTQCRHDPRGRRLRRLVGHEGVMEGRRLPSPVEQG